MKYPCITVDRESEVCRLLTAGAALGVGDDKAPSLLLEQETGIHLLHQVPIRSPPSLPPVGAAATRSGGAEYLPCGPPRSMAPVHKTIKRSHQVYECLGVWEPEDSPWRLEPLQWEQLI